MNTNKLCFVCNRKLSSNSLQLCSSVTSYNQVPYPEKIAELLGEEFVIVVTPNDKICKKCSFFLLYIDVIEGELKRLKDEIVLLLLKNNGLSSFDPLSVADDNTQQKILQKNKKNNFFDMVVNKNSIKTPKNMLMLQTQISNTLNKRHPFESQTCCIVDSHVKTKIRQKIMKKNKVITLNSKNKAKDVPVTTEDNHTKKLKLKKNKLKEAVVDLKNSHPDKSDSMDFILGNSVPLENEGFDEQVDGDIASGVQEEITLMDIDDLLAAIDDESFYPEN